MTPVKFFNFALPFQLYLELKKASHQLEQPIAETARTAIKMYLAEMKAKRGVQN